MQRGRLCGSLSGDGLPFWDGEGTGNRENVSKRAHAASTPIGQINISSGGLSKVGRLLGRLCMRALRRDD